MYFHYLPERDGVVLLLRVLRSLFARSNEEGSVHPHPLQHVLSVVPRQLSVEPLLPEMAVLLGDRVPKDLLKRWALQGVHLIFGEGGGGGRILYNNDHTVQGEGGGGYSSKYSDVQYITVLHEYTRPNNAMTFSQAISH